MVRGGPRGRDHGAVGCNRSFAGDPAFRLRLAGRPGRLRLPCVVGLPNAAAVSGPCVGGRQLYWSHESQEWLQTSTVERSADAYLERTWLLRWVDHRSQWPVTRSHCGAEGGRSRGLPWRWAWVFAPGSGATNAPDGVDRPGVRRKSSPA